jgi:hypothetical protein
MNPLSLLTKGQTFRSFNDRRGAFKSSGRPALPNFAAKSRSASPFHPPAENFQTALFEQPPPAAEAPVSPNRDGAVPMAPVITPEVAALPSEVRADSESIWRRAARWCAGFGGWRRNSARPAASVQTELALDKVTVVRNDLSEDDLVVVPAGKPSRQTTPKAGQQMSSP